MNERRRELLQSTGSDSVLYSYTTGTRIERCTIKVAHDEEVKAYPESPTLACRPTGDTREEASRTTQRSR